MSKERPRPDTAPKVGDGITKGVGSDSYPGTIIAVGKSGLSFHFQEDNAKVVKGSFFTNDAEIEYSPNPTGEIHIARWTVRKGVGAFRCAGSFVSVGFRRYYQDPSF